MRITTVAEFDAALEAGPYAWPGGYPKFFWTAHDEPLSFEVADANADIIRSVIEGGEIYSPWNVTHVDINYEDRGLFCFASGSRIEAAYEDTEAFE